MHSSNSQRGRRDMPIAEGWAATQLRGAQARIDVAIALHLRDICARRLILDGAGRVWHDSDCDEWRADIIQSGGISELTIRLGVQAGAGTSTRTLECSLQDYALLDGLDLVDHSSEYRLSIVEKVKRPVLDVEWSISGTAEIKTFERGPWESRVRAWARASDPGRQEDA